MCREPWGWHPLLSSNGFFAGQSKYLLRCRRPNWSRVKPPSTVTTTTILPIQGEAIVALGGGADSTPLSDGKHLWRKFVIRYFPGLFRCRQRATAIVYHSFLLYRVIGSAACRRYAWRRPNGHALGRRESVCFRHIQLSRIGTERLYRRRGGNAFGRSLAIDGNQGKSRRASPRLRTFTDQPIA